jgi:glycosyltransferase involved in cell wall biosynthesis
MHILIVSHEFAHPSLEKAGGIGHFLADYCQRLVFEGHQVTVFGYNKTSLYETWNGIELNFFASQFTGFYQQLSRVFHKLNYSKGLIPFLAKDKMMLASQIKKYLEKHSVDIIEVNDYLGDGAFLDVDVPVVMRTHGAYKMLEHEVGLRKNEAFTYFEELQLEKLKAIASVSETSANLFCKYFPIDKKDITIIYNGVDLIPDFEKIKNEKKRIFYFGTFSHAKGSDRLVEIINKLPKDRFDIILAGKTEENFKKEVLSNIDKEKQDSLQFLGFLNQPELYKELAKADFVLFTSRLENFSIALLEAMIHKNVCIAWDIPSFNEVINHQENGFVVTDVPEVIDLLTSGQDWKSIKEAARDRVVKNFSKSKMIENSLEFYNRVVK